MPSPALQTPDQLRAVAQLFSDAADAYNVRLKSEAPNLEGNQILAHLQEEQQLRGMANQLHFDAASCVLANGVADQQDLEHALHGAAGKLATFQKFTQALKLVSDLLALGTAIVAAKPGLIISSLKQISADIAAPDKSA